LQLAGQDLAVAERETWRYQFDSDERLKIYLTNTLEEIEAELPTLFGLLRVITEEAKAAAAIKQELPILVVMGNPPYAGHSANSSWTTNESGKAVRNLIGTLLQDYYQVDGKPLGERNPKWLQDDYVKFIRWGQARIEQTGSGILAFITNHGYLDNPTFRGMRQSLMQTFDEIYLLDLHGNAKKKERTLDGGKDENVFDIQQGVTIGLFVKHPQGLKTSQVSKTCEVYHAGLRGRRANKYEWLESHTLNDTPWQELTPQSPFYLFVPQNVDLLPEYEQGWKVTDIFPVNSVGIVTARDNLTIHWTANEVWQTVQDFSRLGVEAARDKYDLGEDARDWKVHLAQQNLRESGLDFSKVKPILYRPFDVRYTYYTGRDKGFICRPRNEVMRQFVNKDNLGLITVRQVAEGIFNHVFVTNYIVESRITTSNKGIGFLFPLYLYQNGQLFNTLPWQPDDQGRIPNLNPDFVADLEKRLGLKLGLTFTPEDIFHYIYAIFHSPTYRQRYAEFLKIDFPRVPLTSNRDLFWQLVALGRQLVGLHLLNQLPPLTTEYPMPGDNEVAKSYPKYEGGRIYLNKRQYFAEIELTTWQFQLGGYQVLDKWLKDRRGRRLSYDELQHYQKIIVALQETERLMAEVDEMIPSWPF